MSCLHLEKHKNGHGILPNHEKQIGQTTTVWWFGELVALGIKLQMLIIISL
jgi:hypothetical protein